MGLGAQGGQMGAQEEKGQRVRTLRGGRGGVNFPVGASAQLEAQQSSQASQEAVPGRGKSLGRKGLTQGLARGLRGRGNPLLGRFRRG